MAIYFLHALDFLHEHEVVHTDLKLDNIQLALPDNETEILQTFVSNAEAEVSSMTKMNDDGAPVYTSREMFQDELIFSILCDLGYAKLGKPPHEGLVQALPYRAPEVMLGASWDSKIDIWSLGVLIWELVLGERLFGEKSQKTSLELILRYLGPPTDGFLRRCARRDEYFDSNGHWKHGKIERMDLEDRVETRMDIPLFFDFLRSMLRWDPRERLSASELLNYPWLQL